MEHDLPTMLARLRGLFELAALPRGTTDRVSVLNEIAWTIGDSLGYGIVAINLLRPAWDDFELVGLHRAEANRPTLLGTTTKPAQWEPFLTERFYARGAYLIPKGSFDWAETDLPVIVPEERGDGDWDPEDALFVPMRDSRERLIGLLSVDEPNDGVRPGDADLDALVAVAAYAARAVESAELVAQEAQRRRGLELLLEVSAKLTSTLSTEEILDAVCVAIRDALGFGLVVIELADWSTDRYVPAASVGLPQDGDVQLDVSIEDLESLFDPALEVEGCTLLSREDALARIAAEPVNFRSSMNGTSPRAWNRHWLLVPLLAPDGRRLGFIWADDPSDRLKPSRPTLQVLRTFANQAATAIESANRRSTLERRTAELEALHDTTLALLEHSEPMEVMQAFVARAAVLMETPNGYLYRVDRARDRLVLEVALGMFSDHVGTELGAGEGLSGRVWAEQRTIAVDDYSTWPAGVPAYVAVGFGAAAGVPLVAGGEVVGVLGVSYEQEGRKFAASDLALLERLAHVASLVFERAELSSRLQEERDYSERLIESANALFVGLDRQGRVETFNAEATRVMGYAAEEVLGRDAFELLLPAGAGADAQAEYTRLLRDGSLPETLETRIRTKAGKERVISWRVSALFENGQAHRVIAFGTDVTDKRRLEVELRQSQKMEAVGRLAGGVAHDFNNMLLAISGYGELALERLEDGTEVREHVFEMKRAGERAASLTRQLLAFSRRQVLQVEVLSVNAIVSELESMLARLLGEQFELVTDLDPKLGRTRADPGQLEQVVMNLVINARDAMSGGGRLAISTRNGKLNGQHTVVLEVSDTGHGMDEQTLAQVFEPFFTTKPSGEGTGLGLSTVYGIVKQTGGEVTASSTPGRGTTMRVDLPRVVEEVAALAEPHHASGGANGATVLLAEDEEIVRRLVAEMLADAGYRVLAAEGGSEAIAVAEAEERIDILLTDVVMPGVGGPALASVLLDLRPDLRVLYMSGYTEEAVASVGPGTAFLQKPFTRAQLVQALQKLGTESLVA